MRSTLTTVSKNSSRFFAASIRSRPTTTKQLRALFGSQYQCLRWNTTQSPNHLSVYDKSDKWEDWFPREEYDNPWLDFGSLDADLKLDKATRYLIQQLQDLYHGFMMKEDRPTTEQCNRILKQMVTAATSDRKALFHNQCAHRADAILKCMELFVEIDPSLDDSSVKLPFPLPHADLTSYSTVLTLYGKTSKLSKEEGPLKCLAVVERMAQQRLALGELNLTPTTFAWNQVLLAWSTCNDPDKAFYAANLLQKMKRDGLVDARSYSHVLRTCAFSDINARSKQLAWQVALKVMKDFLDSDEKADSRAYRLFFLSCQYMLNRQHRDHEINQVFENCCEDGQVNEQVLESFKEAASPQLWQTLLAEHYDNDTKQFPQEWRRNAK